MIDSLLNMNHTDKVVEKLKVPLYWDNLSVMKEEILYCKVACIPKDQLNAILAKYQKMQEALEKFIDDLNKNDVAGAEIWGAAFDEKYKLEEALSFDPLKTPPDQERGKAP